MDGDKPPEVLPDRIAHFPPARRMGYGSPARAWWTTSKQKNICPPHFANLADKTNKQPAWTPALIAPALVLIVSNPWAFIPARLVRNNYHPMILDTYTARDGRSLVLVQVSPRRFKVVLQSATIHQTDGFEFVHMLGYWGNLDKKTALKRYADERETMACAQFPDLGANKLPALS